MLISLFRGAGATGHVFFLKNGRTTDRGLAYSGLVGPKTTVAVIPTTPQILDFAVEARTKDKQSVTVAGNLKVTLSPAISVSKFDFTVDAGDGSYLNAWEQALRAIVVEHVLAPIHALAKTLDVETATQSHKDFEDAVKACVTGATNPLTSKGINFESCSIAKVEVNDDEVDRTIGSKERQAMLADSDKALHDRRLKAAENERAVRAYESETALKLEEERTKLLEKQGENKEKEATTDAAATKTRLAPFNEVDAGKILGAAIMKMAESGRIGNLSIVPEMLAALGQK